MAMVKAPFNGNLNPNEIFATIYNMIISQQVMDPDLNSTYGGLVNTFKVDGSMFGDTKLFYDADVLESRPWLGDAEASNLLNINRPDDPKCQAITLDQFRQIDITVDDYLSKRAWGDEGVFSSFNSLIVGMIGKTKKIYEETMVNSYIGTAQGGSANATYEIPLSDITATGEEKNRLEAQMIAQYIADLLADMSDYSRDYNDYEFLRAYDEGQLMFVWNTKFLNKITKLDLPTIFHNDGLVAKFGEHKLPARYFGEVKAQGGTVGAQDNIRTLVEKTYTSGHKFPGDKLATGDAYLAGEAYDVDEDVICKVITGDTFKYMSAFEVGTNFFNPRSLTTNHYLTFGYAYPDRLLGQPLVVVHAD